MALLRIMLEFQSLVNGKMQQASSVVTSLRSKHICEGKTLNHNCEFMLTRMMWDSACATTRMFGCSMRFRMRAILEQPSSSSCCNTCMTATIMQRSTLDATD